ncbi:Tyrosine-protein phosphatase Lar [Papilio machaon]|uniref:Tyrosine-protein phosphatase Lar n=1 Tax=Papilio machaon TaxID=76193 RepID=A0A194R910_PAPMA|nr:Tyrosine-protein phosphatase Lar [Papilio machaon]
MFYRHSPETFYPPEITIRPQNLQVRVNGIAAFYCAARGDPIPNIQWRKNGKRVSSMQSRYQVSGMDAAAGPGANGAVLRIEPVRATRDDATYECMAENGVGDAVTAVATLTVFEVLIVLRGDATPRLRANGTRLRNENITKIR